MNEEKLNRFAYIDALRGLAALYVFFYHLALLPNPDLNVPYWAKRFVLSGGTGVTLFFVVSAFTMCYSIRARSDICAAFFVSFHYSTYGLLLV
jgi:peptidoglycan/LPS O-acetylase OafA/YrhL